MLYLLPIESLTERYSSWWDSYIPAEIKKLGKPLEIINGTQLTQSVDVGTVLSASGTNYFKSTQLQKICEKFYKKEIAPHSHFLFLDLWFPGIEMIRYMSQLYDIPVNIWGVWHAGSSTMNDFAEPMHPWSKYFEIGFLNLCNGVFVGSDYSKQSIIDRLLYSIPPEEAASISNRIYSYGMPLNYHEIQKYDSNKENIILFPHRPDSEKCPDKFINIMQALSITWEDFKNYKIIFCTSKKQYLSQDRWINALLYYFKNKEKNVEIREDLSKDEYYTLLGKSSLMVSTTSEENFGYCAVEALALSCQVLLPNDFSHPEIVNNNPRFLYDSYDELCDKIPNILKNPVHSKELKELVQPYSLVVENWIKTMN